MIKFILAMIFCAVVGILAMYTKSSCHKDLITGVQCDD